MNHRFSFLKILVKLFPLLHDHILWSRFSGDVFLFHHQWLIDAVGSSDGGGFAPAHQQALLADLKLFVIFQYFQYRYCLDLPAWNSTLRFVNCVLSMHTSSCGISSLWNDMASGWYCFCCCYFCRKVISAVVMVDCNFDHLSCHSPKKTLFGL